MTYYPGVRIRVTVTVTDQTVSPAALADPTTLAVRYGRYHDAPTTKTYPTDVAVVRSSVGTFHIDIDCPYEGDWNVYMASTGVVGAAVTSWTVDHLPI